MATTHTLILTDDEKGTALIWKIETPEQEVALANLIMGFQVWPAISYPAEVTEEPTPLTVVNGKAS